MDGIQASPVQSQAYTSNQIAPQAAAVRGAEVGAPAAPSPEQAAGGPTAMQQELAKDAFDASGGGADSASKLFQAPGVAVPTQAALNGRGGGVAPSPEAALPGLPGLPVPALPGLPGLPSPTGDAASPLPGLPGLPGFSSPTGEAASPLPGLPGLPGFSSPTGEAASPLPGLPGLPGFGSPLAPATAAPVNTSRGALFAAQAETSPTSATTLAREQQQASARQLANKLAAQKQAALLQAQRKPLPVARPVTAAPPAPAATEPEEHERRERKGGGGSKLLVGPAVRF